MDFTTGEWVGIGIGILFGVLLSIYLMLKIIYRGRISGPMNYLGYSTILFLFMLPVEITRNPRCRRKMLVKSGVKEGHVVLEEGFGWGTSPLVAARMVGKRGKVYALDNQPVHVAILRARATIMRVKNLHVILSDAKRTSLPRGSVDVVFINDAFHEFGDKRGTLVELHRVLKPDGLLSVNEDTAGKTNKIVTLVKADNLFSLIERDGKFCKFKRLG